jgi:hypothetical protein
VKPALPGIWSSRFCAEWTVQFIASISCMQHAHMPHHHAIAIILTCEQLYHGTPCMPSYESFQRHSPVATIMVNHAWSITCVTYSCICCILERACSVHMLVLQHAHMHHHDAIAIILIWCCTPSLPIIHNKRVAAMFCYLVPPLKHSLNCLYGQMWVLVDSTANCIVSC